MAFTLVVNPGSSSKKYALYHKGDNVCSMKFERVATGFEQCTERNGTRKKCEGVSPTAYAAAIEHFIEFCVSEGVIASPLDIASGVVRVVVPGTYFQQHTLVTDIYIHKLRDQESAAPLHIPHILQEIKFIRRVLPDLLLVAASDSAFHATMPALARTYSLPRSDTAQFDLYRFGYHGLSVASIVRKHHAVLGSEPTKLVVCHIGSGVSVTAVRDGVSVETTMGYAPGSGLVMASRAGDVDTGALLAIMRLKNLRPLDAQSYLQVSGGLFGVCQEADLRLVLERAAQGDGPATLALEMFVYHCAKSIAATTVALQGLNSLVFTATAGERSATLRGLICTQLAHLGVHIDGERNEQLVSKDGLCSDHASAVKVAVIKTDEMGELYLVGRQLVQL